MFTVIPNHVGQAIARLMSQYGNAENLQNVLSAIINPLQDIESVLNDLNVKRQLSVAEGQQLDSLGTIIGLARPAGADDTTYRQDLYAQIKVNISEGQPEQAIQTFQLFTQAGLVLLNEYFPASVLINSDHVFPTQEDVDKILEIMQEVLPVGVRCNGIVEFDSSIPFAMDGSLSGAGFGDINDPSTGGIWATFKRRGGEFAFAGDDVTAEGFGSPDDPLVGGRFIPRIAAPYFFSAQVPESGDQVEVQTVLASGALTLLPLSGATGFSVFVNAVPATISSVEVAYNSKIILAISSPLIHNGDVVTVSYTPGNVTDSESNVLSAFSPQSVTNNSIA
jgi:hypothetical protein